jgi:hypothetical protein
MPVLWGRRTRSSMTSQMRDRYADKGLALGSDHEHEVHELTMTMRARTLADVAAQLFAAYIVVDELNEERQPDIVKLRHSR